jgi:hypothetical protein
MKVGDKVKWTSQAQGSATTKEGVVMAVVPRRAEPYSIAMRLLKGTRDKFVFGCGGWRDHESYIVRVERYHRKTGAQLASHYYWPRVSALKVVA